DVNLFVGTTQDFTITTFLTNKDACALDSSDAACSGDPGQLAIDPDSHEVRTGHVLIHNGLFLYLGGDLKIAGGLVDIKGEFTFSFSENPFFIEATSDATITLLGIGGLHFDGGFRIDQNGLAFYADIDVGANFGHDIGLSFNASATVTFSTAAHSVSIGGHNVDPGFLFEI